MCVTTSRRILPTVSCEGDIENAVSCFYHGPAFSPQSAAVEDTSLSLEELLPYAIALAA